MTQQTSSALPPLGEHYKVDERQLMLHRSGNGGPTVVFLPGAGLIGLDFLNVHNRTAELTTSVLYDRAGTGWSDRVNLPRSAAEIADELHDLLHAANVPGPYLLVGHSMGGAYVRCYAQRFPNETIGLLLLDPYHEDNPRRMPKQVVQMQDDMKDQELPDLPAEIIEYFRGLFAQKLAAWPEQVREPLIEQHLTEWRTAITEMNNLEEIGEEIRRGPEEPDVPLIVLTAMGQDHFNMANMPEELQREIDNTKCALHQELAESRPQGEHRILDDAGHNWMHVEREDAVYQAIHDLLGRIAK